MVVVIAGGAGKLTRMLRACVAVCAGLLLSVSLILKLEVPFGPLGLPEIRPVLAFNASPAGRVPALTVKVYGASPPAPTTGWL